MLNKKYFIILLFILIGILITLFYANKSSQEILISKNGNFLFYNSPIVAKNNKNIFVAFTDNRGGVWVNRYYKTTSNTPEDSYKVHDYSDLIKKHGFSFNDDHSAPAIVNDSFTQKIKLATSFHGTDLYLYEYSQKKNKFILYKKIIGNYTYPRFLKNKNKILLFVRKMYKKNSKWCGSLVMYKSSDNFSKEHLILDAYSNSIIYASRPFYHKDIVYFAYAIHEYAIKNMTGLNIIGWSQKLNKIVSDINLSTYLDKNYFYNRPTSLAVNSNKIIVATSFFDTKKDFKEEKLYIWTNTVLILEIDIHKKNKFDVKVIHKNKVKAPYYNTDVFIDKNFNWIYFDENKTISNVQISDECFHHKYMMYPHIIGDSVFYTNVNDEHYSIRDFNNSIIECQYYAK